MSSAEVFYFHSIDTIGNDHTVQSDSAHAAQALSRDVYGQPQDPYRTNDGYTYDRNRRPSYGLDEQIRASHQEDPYTPTYNERRHQPSYGFAHYQNLRKNTPFHQTIVGHALDQLVEDMINQILKAGVPGIHQSEGGWPHGQGFAK